MPVKIFFCYAHEDEPLLNKLKIHLRPLQRHGLIDVWHDRDISAGTEWEREIDNHLNTAQIILLLVSPDFIDSDYAYGIEMQRAIERHDRGEAHVIPIILDFVHWQDTPLGKLQALPTDGKPIMSREWQNLNEAFYNVVTGIRKVVAELPTQTPDFLAESTVQKPQPEQTELVKNASKLELPKPELGIIPEEFSLLHTLSDAGTVMSLSLVFSPDGQTLFSGSGGTIKVWNAHTGQLLNTLDGHQDAVGSLAISPDGQTLFSGSHDKTIKAWNVHTGQLLNTLDGHKDVVWSLAISPDGQTLFSGSGDETIKVWNAHTGQLLNTLVGHEDWVVSLAISSDGQILFSRGIHGPIKAWNASTGQLLDIFTKETLGTRCFAISPDGQTLFSSSDDEPIKVWNSHTGQLLDSISESETTEDIVELITSPDGQILFGGTHVGTIKVWNAHTGQLLDILNVSKSHVLALVISLDGKILVSSTKDGSIKVWRIK